MEEYEVDLRDYLRVMWHKKWLILGVFLIAILAAGLISYHAPTRYQSEAVYQWRKLPTISGAQLATPSVQAIAILFESQSLLEQTLRELGYLGRPNATGLKLEVKTDKDLITVRLSGALDPERLQALLEKLIALGIEQLNAQVRAELEREKARLDQQLKLLQVKEEGLSQEIAQLLASASDQQLPVGEFNATLEGFMMRQQLGGLYSRIASLQRQRDALELTRNEVALLVGDPPEVLTVVSTPYKGVPVGPNRKMNLAVAGVLGLFVGVLLAFFVHYLEGPERAQGQESKAKAEEG